MCNCLLSEAGVTRVNRLVQEKYESDKEIGIEA